MATILGKYEYVKQLGTGGFGLVVLVKDPDNNQFAIKCLQRKKVQMSDSMGYIKNQIKIMQQLNDCEYTVHLYDHKMDQNFIYLVLEYCNGRDLEKLRCQRKDKVFELEQATWIISEVLKGLEAIHAKGYLHRDIKMQNVMVKTEKDIQKIKIADFGLSKPQIESSTIVGTNNYFSPEMLQDYKYGYEVDMWALGVMFYFMLNKEYPFQIKLNYDFSNKQQCYKDLMSQAQNFSYRESVNKTKSKIKENCTPEVQDLFKRIFQFDSEKRITFVQIRQHPIFRKYFVKKMDEKVVEMINKNQVTRKFDMPKKSTIISEENQRNQNVPPKFQIGMEINPNFQYAKQQYFLHHKNQQIQFLYDNYNELDHSHGLLTYIQKIMLCYNLLKYYIILKRNFISLVKSQNLIKTHPNYKFQDYFTTAEFEQQMKEYNEQLQRATEQFKALHEVCGKNLEAIEKNNSSFGSSFNQNIKQKELDDFKTSYRKSTNTTFSKMRKFLGTDNNRGNSCNYYLAMVAICHVFNRIFLQKNKISNVFKDFLEQEGTSVDELDYSKLRQWMSKAAPMQLNAVTRNIMKYYLQ